VRKRGREREGEREREREGERKGEKNAFANFPQVGWLQVFLAELREDWKRASSFSFTSESNKDC